MKCAFCGEKAVKTKLALAEGGCVKLPVCDSCEEYVKDTFDNPLKVKDLANMQRRSM